MNASQAGDAVLYQSLLAQRGGSDWWTMGMRSITWAVLGQVRASERLLDEGCGPGWLLTELPPGVRGVGLDRQAQGFVAGPVSLGDAQRLPFAGGAFDLLLTMDMLEQVGLDPGQALCEAARVLAPGGRLLLRVPAHPWLQGPHDLFWGGARRYRRGEVAALVRGAGFKIRRLTYANSLLFPIIVPARLLSRWRADDGDDLRPLPAPLNRLLLGILRMEARWLRRHDFPMGLSLLCLAERPE